MTNGAKYRQAKYCMPTKYRDRLFAKFPGKVEAAKIMAAWRLFQAHVALSRSDEGKGSDLSKGLFERLLSDRADAGGRVSDLNEIARWIQDEYGIEVPGGDEWVIIKDLQTLTDDGDGDIVALIEKAEPHFGGPETSWMERIDHQQTGYEAALEEAEPCLRLRLAAMLRRYWYARGLFEEGRERIESALAGCADEGLVRAKALAGIAAFRCVHADLDGARAACRTALGLIESEPGGGDVTMLRIVGEIHGVLGTVAHHAGDPIEAERSYRRGLEFYEEAGAPE